MTAATSAPRRRGSNITLLTIGYMVARGLAKSGARNFYDDGIDDHGRNNR